MTVDVLAVGAHPDDADLGVGGCLLKLGAEGRSTAILDLTRGELASRGSVEERHAEAAESARLLGVDVREQAGLPDGGLDNVPGQRDAVIRVIRALRPRVLLAPMTPDRHPDHRAAHDLVRDANFYAGVGGVETGQDPYRAGQVFFYHPYFEAPSQPEFVVDISDYFETKRCALRAFASQFHNPAYAGAETLVASKDFWDAIETRAAYWGGRIGVRYGEALYAAGPAALDLGALAGGGKG